MHLSIGEWEDTTGGVTVDIAMGRMITKQLSIEAGFTYNIENLGHPRNCTAAFLAMIAPKSCPQSYNQMLTEVLHHYDMAVPWWGITLGRLQHHDFTAAYVDTSLTLFTMTGEEAFGIEWLSFAAPFTGRAWLLVLFMCIVTGVSLFSFEDHRGESLKELEKGIVMKVEQAMQGLISGSHEPTDVPHSTAVKMVEVSFSIVVLVVLSAYTANTAAFLTVEASKPSSLVSKLSDIMDKEYTACAFTSDGFIEEKVRDLFPMMQLQTSSLTSNSEYIGNMKAGHCQASFTYAQNVKYMKSKLANCDVKRVGIACTVCRV
jgi:hypothetical protein